MIKRVHIRYDHNNYCIEHIDTKLLFDNTVISILNRYRSHPRYPPTDRPETVFIGIPEKRILSFPLLCSANAYGRVPSDKLVYVVVCFFGSNQPSQCLRRQESSGKAQNLNLIRTCEYMSLLRGFNLYFFTSLCYIDLIHRTN